MKIERYGKKYSRKLVTLDLFRYTSHRKHFKNKKLLFHFHLSYSFIFSTDSIRKFVLIVQLN